MQSPESYFSNLCKCYDKSNILCFNPIQANAECEYYKEFVSKMLLVKRQEMRNNKGNEVKS